uniref:hypothetical protein n=1 Tax=Vibrio vulnificus TaxID=672 RepID=UPI001595D8A4|nr:hypothetical protein [Vibrio vulnificus]
MVWRRCAEFLWDSGVVIGFALCSCWLWQVRFQASHLACVDEWIPVCTGMTIGGVVAVF